MDFCLLTEDSSWWLTVLPVFLGTKPLSDGFVIFYLLVSLALVAITTLVFSSGGAGWKNGRNQRGPVSITGPHGLPVFGSLFSFSRGLAHRTLASMALGQAEKQLMAFSLGSTPVVVSSDPNISKEILTSPHFSNRPIKQSAKMLRFDRAIGFAPDGTYRRLIRKISSTHLFAPKRIAAHEAGRQLDCAVMLSNIAKDQSSYGFVGLRKHLQDAALNNIMGSVFGKRYDVVNDYCQLKELQEMVREGFELLGAFNWSDHIPWLSNFYDPLNMKERCTSLASRVRKLVLVIIKEHENKSPRMLSEKADFVDVLLSLDCEEKLEEDDMIAVLWEMIFRGTDTTALLTEWIMAELILNPTKQSKLRNELDVVVGNKIVKDTDIARLPYLEAVVKETLRVHPPGPLLSWARISTDDVKLSNGMLIPANTTAMINMWAITHDPNVWEEPLVFKPERFVQSDGGVSVDVRGNDLRLAPFGAGRRVCPGKNLGLVTVNLWVAKLVQKFIWVEHHVKPVDLSEVLKLSCEMRIPLSAVAIPRNVAYHV